MQVWDYILLIFNLFIIGLSIPLTVLVNLVTLVEKNTHYKSDNGQGDTYERHGVVSTIAAEQDLDEILISATDPDKDDLMEVAEAMSTTTRLPVIVVTAGNSTAKAFIAYCLT